MSDLSDMFDVIRGCCLHDPQWLPDDVEKIVRWEGDRQNGPESSSIVIVRLKPQDGEEYWQRGYGLMTQGEDFTGHGCQCDSMTVREKTLAKLLTHLDDSELGVLIGGKDD